MILEEMNVDLDNPQRYVGSVDHRLLYDDQPSGGNPRHEGDDRGDDTRHVHFEPRTPGTSLSESSSASSSIDDGVLEQLEGAPWGHRGAGDRNTRTVELPPERSPCSCTPSSRSKPTSSSEFAAIRSGPGPLRAPAADCRARRRMSSRSSPRCGSTAASRTTSTPAAARTSTPARSIRERGLCLPRRRGHHDDPRRAARDRRGGCLPTSSRRRAGTRRARFVLRLEARRARSIRAPARGSRGRDRGAEILRRLDEVTAEDIQRVARDLVDGKRLTRRGRAVRRPARFEKLIAGPGPPHRLGSMSERELLRRTAEIAGDFIESLDGDRSGLRLPWRRCDKPSAGRCAPTPKTRSV